jgi:dihydroorotate dehydrogenase electron transfer subunit
MNSRRQASTSASLRKTARWALEPLLAEAEHNGAGMRFYGCGPAGMTFAMARLVLAHGLDAELSVDHAMCCGVGACFACVVKVKDRTKEKGWRYARACSEGPVFTASNIYL